MQSLARKKILIVEDDPQVAYALSKRLSHASFDVLWTHSGQDAIYSARSQHPALITLDIRLPDLDGREVALQLRQEQETANIPIIFITGAESGHVTEGVDDVRDCYFIRKPYDPAQLIKLINSLLARDELGEMRKISETQWRQPMEQAAPEIQHYV